MDTTMVDVILVLVIAAIIVYGTMTADISDYE